MKKILTLLFAALMVSMSLSAQKVGYLLTAATIDALPLENEGGVDQKPEQNAANWFVSAYGSNAQLVSLSDLASLDPATVKVLWINIDRTALADLAAAGIDAAAVTAIGNYVKAGGNLLLTKQAAHLAYSTGRIGYAPEWNNVGYHDGGDTWYIKTKLGGGTANPTDRSNHAIYKNIAMVDGQFPLVGAVKRSDRNNKWNDFFRKDPNTGGILDDSDPSTNYDNMNVQRLLDFEGDWNCEALATWPQIHDYCLPMIINFKPGYETFTGGMLAICLAAYQWGKASYEVTDGPIANVKKLTQNCIEYLYGSDPRPQVEASWNVTPADGVIGGSMTASVTTAGTISWSSSDNTVASVSSEGVIAYNGFGSCTITAVVSKDGYADKNLEQTITITGGAAATYAYALPYSLYTMQHYDNEEGFYPDYQAAKWFYDNYVALGTGCFINPTAYSASTAFPSAINVLWVNNDHVGLARDTYYDNLGGNNFKDALEAFVKAGGKVFLSMQATRLANDIGRISVAPEYRMNGWQGRDENARYMTADFYALKDADESRVGLDRHNHSVYKYLPNSAWVTHNEGGLDVYCKWQLMDFTDANRRTDNNAIWENWDGYTGAQDAVHLARATKFEEDHHCVILGGYGHTTALDGVGFVEFYPYGDYNGTVIALGLHSYEWGTNNSLVANVQYLTKGTLEYLASADIYTRNVPADHYGTICLPRASASLSDGMTVYRVLSDQTDGIMLEEVNAMEAGVPYFFYSTATQISVTMTGAAELTPQNGNGLVGNFGPASVEIPNETDNYILGSDNTLYYIDQAGIMLGANRAYLDRSTIGNVTPSNMPKRIMRIQNAPSVATALDNAETPATKPVKILMDGQLMIQMGDQLYDVTGTQVK